jgi:hypothetical protein
MTFDIFREGRVHVLSEECATCVFRPHERPVPGATVAGIVRDTKDVDGSTLVCHSTILYAEHSAICRGWYERLGDKDAIVGAAKRIGIIEYDEPPGKGSDEDS